MRTITLQSSDPGLLPATVPEPEEPAAQAVAGGVDRRAVVLHFAYTIGGGGAEAMLMNLAQSLSPKRFRTVVVTINARPWPHLMRRLQAAGVTVHDLEATSYLQLSTLKRLHAIFRAERPDIVQTWMHHADLIGGWVARLALVPKVVWSIHCREIHRNPGDSDRRLSAFRTALVFSSRFIPSRIVSCSAAAIEDHMVLGYPRSKMRWIPNGIDSERFRPDADAALDTRAEFNIPPQAPVIGFLGRFHEMKDLATFLRAAHLLQSRLPQVHFVFCGGVEVEMSPEERALLAQLPQRQQVRFAAFRPDPWRLYPALNVFSLSSRTEACPMTLIEAMSCGVPCVATDVGDCARLLEGCGTTVPARQPEALAQAWEDVLRLAPTERVELSERSRQRVLEHFSLSHAAQQYEQTYLELLEVRS